MANADDLNNADNIEYTKYKAVFFDFDYTLADSSNGVCQSMAHGFKNMGYDIPPHEEMCKTIGLPLTEMFRIFTQNTDTGSYEIFASFFVEKAEEVMNDNTVLFDDVPDTIGFLCGKGIKCGVVSTKFRTRINEVLERDGLADKFDIVVGGEDVAALKPDPEGLLKAIGEFGLNKDECLYVGDSVTDAKTAQNAGVDFIAVLSGKTTREQLMPYPNIHMIQELSGLCKFILP